MAAKKKSTAKKAASTPSTPIRTSELTPEERNAIIDQLIANAEKEHGPGCVQRAEHTNASYLLRRPVGITSVDIGMAGGFPAAAPSVLVGPDGAGKDYMLWRTAAEVQALYGDNFCMAVYFTEFKPDKLYMKDKCGFQIAFSETELEELDQARREMGHPSLTAEELDHYRHQVGTFIPIVGVSADRGFDEVFNFLDANVCQVIAVNSIGFLQTEAKESKESFTEFAQQSNEATLLTKALTKFSMYMNRGSTDGRPNQTSLILVNQVRSKETTARPMGGRPPQEKDKYKTAANAWALKHGKAIELFIHNGGFIYDEGAKPPMVLGRKKQWEITKGKLGTHEGIKGEFDYIHGYGADVLGDLVNTATKLGVLTVSGSWISYNENGIKFQYQGGHRVMEYLRKEPEAAAAIRIHCMQASGVTCRYV